MWTRKISTTPSSPSVPKGKKLERNFNNFWDLLDKHPEVNNVKFNLVKNNSLRFTHEVVDEDIQEILNDLIKKVWLYDIELAKKISKVNVDIKNYDTASRSKIHTKWISITSTRKLLNSSSCSGVVISYNSNKAASNNIRCFLTLVLNWLTKDEITKVVDIIEDIEKNPLLSKEITSAIDNTSRSVTSNIPQGYLLWEQIPLEKVDPPMFLKQTVTSNSQEAITPISTPPEMNNLKKVKIIPKEEKKPVYWVEKLLTTPPEKIENKEDILAFTPANTLLYYLLKSWSIDKIDENTYFIPEQIIISIISKWNLLDMNWAQLNETWIRRHLDYSLKKHFNARLITSFSIDRTEVARKIKDKTFSQEAYTILEALLTENETVYDVWNKKFNFIEYLSEDDFNALIWLSRETWVENRRYLYSILNTWSKVSNPVIKKWAVLILQKWFEVKSLEKNVDFSPIKLPDTKLMELIKSLRVSKDKLSDVITKLMNRPEIISKKIAELKDRKIKLDQDKLVELEKSRKNQSEYEKAITDLSSSNDTNIENLDWTTKKVKEILSSLEKIKVNQELNKAELLRITKEEATLNNGDEIKELELELEKVESELFTQEEELSKIVNELELYLAIKETRVRKASETLRLFSE